MKIQEVIDQVIQKCNMDPIENTCDIIVEGNPDGEINGIVTTFMATVDVIKKAVSIGANFIITHEPTYFTAADRRDWLIKDPVYLQKKKLIDEAGICIWRFHDHMHGAYQDLIFDGMREEFGWQNCRFEEDRNYFAGFYNPHESCFHIEPTTVEKLSLFLKEKLNMEVIQVIGNRNAKCENIGLALGGASIGVGIDESFPMQFMEMNGLDTLLCGDITEWTLCAYARDAVQLNLNKSLIIIGHERSEEAGMKYLPEWIKSITGNIPVTFIDSKEPFTYL